MGIRSLNFDQSNIFLSLPAYMNKQDDNWGFNNPSQNIQK